MSFQVIKVCYMSVLMALLLCVRGVPAAAGPVLPNGPAQFLNADVIKRELHRLQHGSKQAHISRSVKQTPKPQSMFPSDTVTFGILA